MIRRLRARFIGLAMVSLCGVLLVTMLVIQYLYWRQMLQRSDGVLDVLTANHGVFPESGPWEGEFGMEPVTPETPYELRYFSVQLDAGGQAVFADIGKIAAIDRDTAVQYAGDALQTGDTLGFLGNYRFKIERGGGGTLVVFLDCTRNQAAAKSLLVISMFVSLLVTAVFFAVIFVLSGRVVRPISESYEKQKQFITDAGHELKTPLAIIDADADVLSLDIGENEWLEDIKKQSRRLAALTRDLIFLSRMEEEQPRLQTIDLPLSDLVEETAQSFQAMAITQKKTFTTRIQPMLMVHGEEKTLRQLISILLDNALKYSGDEGVISLSLQKKGRFLSLTVHNTSEAMDKESISHLFDRFYRGDKSRNSTAGGYGIGLSVAKAIVENHKGTISAASKDGRSLTITVTLPARESP